MIERSTPRVSDVLRLIDNTYEQIPEELLAVAAERGTYLHQLVLSHFAAMQGNCAAPIIAEIPEQYRRCYAGAMEWAANNQIEPILVEQRAMNTVYGFTGQPDLLAYKGPKRIKTLFDLKFTAMILDINRVQLRAYQALPMFEDAEGMEIVKVNWLTGRVKSEPVYTNGTGDWAAFLVGLKKLRLLEEVEALDEQLAIWRGDHDAYSGSRQP